MIDTRSLQSRALRACGFAFAAAAAALSTGPSNAALAAEGGSGPATRTISRVMPGQTFKLQYAFSNDGCNGVTGWYVDHSSNSVVLTTARGTAAQATDFVRSAGVNPAAVKVVESDEAPRTYSDVMGGNGYYINNATRCSVGFSVQGGFVSAGHCGKAGDSTTQPNGTFAASSFPGNDFSHINVNPGETPRPLVNDFQGGTVAVKGSAEAPEGAPVCRSGSTSHSRKSGCSASSCSRSARA